MILLVLAATLGATPAPTEPSAPLRVPVFAPELSPAQQKALQDAAESVLEDLTAFRVEPQPSTQDCRDAACLRRSADGGKAFVVGLSAAVPNLVLELRAAFYDPSTGAVVTKVARGGNPDAPTSEVRALVKQVLPKWVQPGHAFIQIRAPADSVVRVDGRRTALTPLQEPVAVPAGVHEIDVVFPTGSALLFRRRLEAGALFQVEATPSTAVERLGLREQTPRSALLRPASYALWSAGAVALAGSLVAGGFARSTSARLVPCSPTERGCVDVNQRAQLERQAQGYANTGNILLVTGAVLGSAGAGLFVFDVVGSK